MLKKIKNKKKTFQAVVRMQKSAGGAVYNLSDMEHTVETEETNT